LRVELESNSDTSTLLEFLLEKSNSVVVAVSIAWTKQESKTSNQRDFQAIVCFPIPLCDEGDYVFKTSSRSYYFWKSETTGISRTIIVVCSHSHLPVF